MKIGRRSRLHYRSRPWFPFFILAIGIVATLTTAYYVDLVADSKDRLLFERSVTQTRELIDKRFDSYIALLRSGAGLFATQQEITLPEFQHYVSFLDLANRYKGVQGLGYSLRVPAEQKDSVVAYMRSQGVSTFTLLPDSVRDEYHTIIYLEPEDRRNEAAIGYDMFTIPTRKAAMEKARDMGQPITSGKVILQQETDPRKKISFIIYVPVYSGIALPTTVEQRRAALRGFVFSPFRTGDVFASILENQGRDVAVAIYDGNTTDTTALLYSSTGKPVVKSPLSSLISRSTMIIAGRVWTLSIVPTSVFVNSFERAEIPLILAGGFMMSFILYLLSRGQYVSRIRTEKLAMELLQSKEALEVSEGRLRRIIDANVIGVAYFKLGGSISAANDAFLHMIGYSRKDLQDGKVNFFDLTPKEFRKADALAIRQLKKKGSYKPYEKEYIRKDGTLIPVLLGIASIPGSKNEGIGLLVDLTERKKLERQKDEFISIASHELKTPVTSLKAYAQVLAKRLTNKGDTESAAHLLKMNNQLDRLTNLIRELLDVTKIEAGKLQLQTEMFDLSVLVKEVVEELQRTTDQHQIRIEGLKNPIPLHGDRERIGQVLVNLLSNAIKYSPNADKIIVSIRSDKDTVTVCVKDFGVGIPKDQQVKVFDRFFRVDDSAKQTFPGLGLGLYISAEIIKRQKGKIWVESETGKGSTFCFSLPTPGV